MSPIWPGSPKGSNRRRTSPILTIFLAALVCFFAAIGASVAQGTDVAQLRAEAFELFAGTAADKSKAIGLFEQAAAAGDGTSMSFLGDLYLSGNGVAADREKAIGWYLKAAEAGHTASAAKLASLAAGVSKEATTSEPPVPDSAPADPAEKPSGPAISGDAETLRKQGLKRLADRDYAVAFANLLAAAEQGDAPAMTAVAGLYLSGRGTTRSKPDAIEWYQAAADKDDVAGITRLADLYANGNGVVKDAAKADNLIAEAVALTDAYIGSEPSPAEAHAFVLGFIDIASTDPQKRQLQRLLVDAANKGYIPAIRTLAEHSSREDAISWWTLAANGGDAGAMFQLGQIYQRRNTEMSLEWYRKAEAAGNSEAKATREAYEKELASEAVEEAYSEGSILYRNDDGSGEDFAKARERFKFAADQGHVNAAVNLGAMLQNGEGGPIDYAASHAYLTRAAESGSAGAMLFLGTEHELARGTYRNLPEALTWYRRALEAGDDSAQEDVTRVETALAILPPENTLRGDRWSTFNYVGEYAAGISIGERGLLAFICNGGNIGFYYVPPGPPASDVLGNVNMYLLFHAAGVSPHGSEETLDKSFWFTGPLAADRADKAAAASSIDIGTTPNRDGSGDLMDFARVTARGSSAAIAELRAACPPGASTGTQ
jgi:TPR repeat protein